MKLFQGLHSAFSFIVQSDDLCQTLIAFSLRIFTYHECVRKSQDNLPGQFPLDVPGKTIPSWTVPRFLSLRTPSQRSPSEEGLGLSLGWMGIVQQEIVGNFPVLNCPG